MTNKMGRWLLAFAMMASMHVATAEVRLPQILGSHMVLQREEPVHIWGWAKPAEAVHVDFRGETRTARADAVGRWEVYLAPGVAGGPFVLTVEGENKITLEDILVGDLWIASGQSNMEMPLAGFGAVMPIRDGEKEIAAANYPQIRLLRVKNTTSQYPLDDAVLAARWDVCTPETARTFSAAGYFFARDVQAAQKIPIGVVQSTWGGTPVEAWTSLHALSHDQNLASSFSFYDDMLRDRAGDLKKADLQAAEDAALKAAGKPIPPRASLRNIASWQPSSLFNGMIAPLIPLRIKGVIWYQGESNADTQERAALYQQSFSAMIADWREDWSQGNFPFFYVQISAYGPLRDVRWATVREGQRRTLAVANTAMAVSIDIGELKNIHPANKQDVAARLALAARAVAYGEKIEYSGPLFREAVPAGSSMRVWFDHAEGLKAKGGPLFGFEVAGADKKFFDATAKIVADGVEVSSDKVPAPVYVRYGWIGSPEVNLYNGHDLPASPFTNSH